jgi:glycosyltransferase involved in cell wall biosynthesis
LNFPLIFLLHIIKISSLKVGALVKVLLTFYIPSGGIETLNRQRYAALKKQDIDCHFLYLSKASGVQNMKDMPVYITNKDEEIRGILMKENYDVIIICLDYLFVSRMRRLGYKGKMVYDVQGFGDQIDTLLTNAKEHVEPHVDAVMFPQTPHLQEKIDNHLPSINKFSFHNCLDTDTFSYRKKPTPNKTIVGWVGRIERNKNWRLFLRIGAKLIASDPLIELWMFIDPALSGYQERQQFNRWIERLNLSNHLKIHTNIPHHEMPDYYSIIGDSGGFLCSTSKLEGFGYAVLEAMSCRCPVLSTDSDGVKSFIKHNVTGKFFPLKNAKKGVKEANELIHNKELREIICANALKHIKSHFTLEHYCRHFIQMLEEIR